MPQNSSFRIAVMPGDGIGTEIMPPCLEILRRVQDQIGGFGLDFEELPAGADHYRETGTALPEDSLRRAGEADAVLLGAMGLPSVRYPDGREIAPQLDLRETFELFAGLRPVRSLPGLPGPLADTRAQDLDFVLIRAAKSPSVDSRISTKSRSWARGSARGPGRPGRLRTGRNPAKSSKVSRKSSCGAISRPSG